ncbi:MAG: S-adenosylmethionine-binding protein, partial [Dehalococcoidia bacterium]|nr:S-adenosylmethionine-binding protein [Dehalococcoidia bacterium]
MSGKYRTIVADPPWHVGAGPEWASNGPSRKLEYPTMTFDEIAALPVKAMSADGAHLYIWTINAYLERTYDLARTWGFKPSTLL